MPSVAVPPVVPLAAPVSSSAEQPSHAQPLSRASVFPTHAAVDKTGSLADQQAQSGVNSAPSGPRSVAAKAPSGPVTPPTLPQGSALTQKPATASVAPPPPAQGVPTVAFPASTSGAAPAPDIAYMESSKAANDPANGAPFIFGPTEVKFTVGSAPVPAAAGRR
jgi:hypothetical protein